MDFDWLQTRLAQASDIEKVLAESSAEICEAFVADRLSIYRAVDDGAALVAVVQMGLDGFGAVKVRMDSNRSVAGHVGSTRKVVNIRDAYDDAELEPLQMKHKMLRAIDERTGYRTTQVLAAPIVADGKLVGVIELLNRKDGRRFPTSCEKDVAALCEVLAQAFARTRSTALS
jgi:GAF domain-containing protein